MGSSSSTVVELDAEVDGGGMLPKEKDGAAAAGARAVAPKPKEKDPAGGGAAVDEELAFLPKEKDVVDSEDGAGADADEPPNENLGASSFDGSTSADMLLFVPPGLFSVLSSLSSSSVGSMASTLLSYSRMADDQSTH